MATTTTTNSVTVSSMLGTISNYVYDPASIQRNIMACLNSINNGTISIVDATNPFVQCLEQSSVNTAAAMQQAAALTRRQYPAAATTLDDLYIHMSDVDYIDIFALPSVANFTFLIGEKVLLNKLVLDPNTGISQVVIPRNTVITTAGIPFSLQYPIVIRQLSHGGLQIVYDATIVSPLQTLTTNVIPYTTINNQDGTSYIVFEVEAQQFAINSLLTTVTASGGYSKSVPFVNEYYYCRVYNKNADGTWNELATTYTEMVFDINTPTVVVKVDTNSVTVTVPVIYVTNNIILGSIRIDVYYTQGPMTMLLGNLQKNDFVANFMYLDQNDATPYVAAFIGINQYAVYSNDITSGGRAALTFTQLQERVINSSIGPRNIPITPAQIQNTLLDYGYTLVKNIDVITNRSYWATKSLPAPTDSSHFTPANASVLTIITNIANGVNLQGCTTHSTGMTITSSALIQNSNGISSLVTISAYKYLLALPLAELASSINNGGYTYTPFYYVLDNTSDTFEVRPYYLDSPTIINRSFIQENPATGLQVSIDATYSIVKNSTGYLLTISTNSNSTYQTLPDNEVFCQLCFNSNAQSQNAYMLGTQLPRTNNSGERTYQFQLNTNYDIDVNDNLLQQSCITTVSGYTPRSALLQSFNILFATNSSTANTVPTTNIDTYLGLFQLPSGVIGITNEILNVQFGYSLTTLWNSYRSIVAPVPYQTYTADVYATYSKDIYETDTVTGASFKIVNGEIVYNKLYNAGDFVLDTNGNKIILHKAGDAIIDPVTNLPTPIENYNSVINRSLDVVTLDGIYYFANDAATLTYVSQIDNFLISSLTKDLITINNEVLEQTEIYFYPVVSKGVVTALVDNNKIVNLEAAQSFTVTLYVTNETYNDSNLIAKLTSSTIKTIGNYLYNNTLISTSQLNENLSIAYGTDVISVNLSGLGGSNNYNVVTLTDSSNTLSINKKLQLQPNNQLAVVEDVSIIFNIHDNGN